MQDILQVMQQDGYLTPAELVAIRKTCRELGENPVRILRSLNIASPEEIQSYLQRYCNVNALKDEGMEELNSAYQIFLPIDLALNYSCFAIGELNERVFIALEDPSDRGVIRQLEFFLNKKVVGIAATVFQIAQGLNKIYSVPLSSLKLTTLIDKSRGVIAGSNDESYLRRQKEISSARQRFVQQEQAKVQKDYHDYAKKIKKAALSSEDSLLQEILSGRIGEPSPLTEAAGQATPNLTTESQTSEASGIGASAPSNDILNAPADLKSSPEEAEAKEAAPENVAESAAEAPPLAEAPPEEKKTEIVETETLKKLSPLVSSMLVKLSIETSKMRAIEIVNSKISALNMQIGMENNEFFMTISGEKINFADAEKGELYPLIKNSLSPLFLKISRMKKE